MKFILHKLLSLLNYLQIFHLEKTFFDWIMPIVYTIGFILCNEFLLPHKIAIIGEHSLVSVVNGILQILAGFYIASLAAIATASLPRLDEEMKGASPFFLFKRDKTVTRRVFLTHLFGYLSFLSLFVYFSGGVAQITLENIVLILHKAPYIKIGLMFIYLFLIFNIVFVTILGLFFMIEDNINKVTPN